MKLIEKMSGWLCPVCRTFFDTKSDAEDHVKKHLACSRAGYSCPTGEHDRCCRACDHSHHVKCLCDEIEQASKENNQTPQ